MPAHASMLHVRVDSDVKKQVTQPYGAGSFDVGRHVAVFAPRAD